MFWGCVCSSSPCASSASGQHFSVAAQLLRVLQLLLQDCVCVAPLSSLLKVELCQRKTEQIINTSINSRQPPPPSPPLHQPTPPSFLSESNLSPSAVSMALRPPSVNQAGLEASLQAHLGECEMAQCSQQSVSRTHTPNGPRVCINLV